MEGMPEAVTEGGAGLKAVIEGGAGLKAVMGGGAEAAAPTKPTSEIQEVSEVQVSEDPELMAVSEVSAARVRGTAAERAVETGSVAAAPQLRCRSGYNADTPTSLFEAAVVQWRWLEQLIASGCLPHDADQFNSLHERLIARWRAVVGDNFVHLACMMRSVEDRVTLAYIEDCAEQAGLPTKALDMGDIGLDRSTFVDRSGRAVRHLFKCRSLYLI